MKHKITLTVVVEFDVNPEHYPSQIPEDMLNTDIEGMKSDPYLFMEMPGAEFAVTGEIIN